jgi:hypothetical protein
MIIIKLFKEKNALEEQLEESVLNLKEAKSYMSTLQQQTKEEKRIKAKFV